MIDKITLHDYIQKAIPLVYDESLSYYEILLKVVTQINEMIPLIYDIEENILTTVHETIQTMIDDGTFETIIAPMVETKADKTYVDAIVALKADMQYVDAQLALKADKTTMDSELALKATKTELQSVEIALENADIALQGDITDILADLATKATKTDVQNVQTSYQNADNALDGRLDAIESTSVMTQGAGNGWYYAKFANGFMITYSSRSISVTITNAWGQIFNSSGLPAPADFPVKYADIPQRFVFGRNDNLAMWFATGGSTELSMSNFGSIQACRGSSTPTATVHIDMVAIGRWK